jgi:hypothetical protein
VHLRGETLGDRDDYFRLRSGGRYSARLSILRELLAAAERRRALDQSDGNAHRAQPFFYLSGQVLISDHVMNGSRRHDAGETATAELA